MIEDVKKVQLELEGKYIANITAVDSEALSLHKKKSPLLTKYLTDYSVKTGNQTVKRWKDLSHYLLVKYIDGNIKKEENGQFIRKNNLPVSPKQTGYPEWYRRKIVESTGDKLKVTGGATH